MCGPFLSIVAGCRAEISLLINETVWMRNVETILNELQNLLWGRTRVIIKTTVIINRSRTSPVQSRPCPVSFEPDSVTQYKGFQPWNWILTRKLIERKIWLKLYSSIAENEDKIILLIRMANWQYIPKPNSSLYAQSTNHCLFLCIAKMSISSIWVKIFGYFVEICIFFILLSKWIYLIKFWVIICNLNVLYNFLWGEKLFINIG